MSPHAKITRSSDELDNLYILPPARQDPQTRPWTAASSVNGAHVSTETFSRFMANVAQLPNNEDMQPVSKDLLDARLEAIEARMDARVAGMSAKLDTALAEMRADREANNIRFATVLKDIGSIQGAVAETNSRFKSVIGNVWGAALATVTVVGATLAIAISSFDSGRETSKSIAEATARMEQLQKQLEAQATAASVNQMPAPAPTSPAIQTPAHSTTTEPSATPPQQ